MMGLSPHSAQCHAYKENTLNDNVEYVAMCHVTVKPYSDLVRQRQSTMPMHTNTCKHVMCLM